jgi:hypothetical protein
MKFPLPSPALLCLLPLMCLAAASPLGADEDAEEETLYPTLLSAAYDAESPRAGSIEILFEGVEGENVRYRIYREPARAPAGDETGASAPPGSAVDLSAAELAAEVTAGELPYRDVPPESGGYRYAVTAVVGGEERRTLVPYQNATVSPIDFAPLPPPIERFEVRRGRGSGVSILFSPRTPQTGYRLYVSGSPVETLEGLEASQTVTGGGEFQLVLRENVPYYFAITPVNRLGAENRNLTPGKSASAQPYRIEPPVVPAPPKPRPPSVPEKPPPRKEPPSAKAATDRVLKTSFFEGRHAEALVELRSILARGNLNTRDASTLHFYIGQCEFYLGEYRSAIRSFVLSKEDSVREKPAEAWIERCLDRLD